MSRICRLLSTSKWVSKLSFELHGMFCESPKKRFGGKLFWKVYFFEEVLKKFDSAIFIFSLNYVIPEVYFMEIKTSIFLPAI